MNESQLKIQTKDDKFLKINRKIVQFSTFIQTTLEDTNEEDIPLDITSEILQKVQEFYQHFNYDRSRIKHIIKPLQSSNFAHITDDWCAGFFKSLTEEQVTDIIMAASYLQSPELFDYSCAYVASGFKDITQEEMKQTYGITEEFTPELEDQIKLQYNFLFKDLMPSNTDMILEKK